MLDYSNIFFLILKKNNFENSIEINIKNIPNNFIRFKIYEDVLEIFKLNKVDIIIKYYDQEFLVYNEIDLKNVFKKL